MTKLEMPETPFGNRSLNFGRRVLLFAVWFAGSALLGRRVALPTGVFLFVKEISLSWDSFMKSSLGPCGLLLWCMDDTAPWFLLACAVIWVAWLVYQGLEATPVVNLGTSGGPKYPPAAGVIWLHGLGDTAKGCSVISKVIKSPKSTRWVFPAAPVRQVSADWGLPRRAWFDMATSPVRPGALEDQEGMRSSAEYIHTYIRRLEAEGIPSDCIFLGGFSQGAAAALVTALTYPVTLGGVICVAGWLPRCVPLDAPGHPAPAKSKKRGGEVVRQACPVFWHHGRQDRNVPISMQDDGAKSLKAAGLTPSIQQDEEGGHDCGLKQVEAIEEWLGQVLKVDDPPEKAADDSHNHSSEK